MDPGAEELRQRAVELRRVAADVSDTGIDELIRWAGPDTWRSPGAEACRATLECDRQRLLNAADELRDGAWRLERQADAADALAALRPLT